MIYKAQGQLWSFWGLKQWMITPHQVGPEIADFAPAVAFSTFVLCAIDCSEALEAVQDYMVWAGKMKSQNIRWKTTEQRKDVNTEKECPKVN